MPENPETDYDLIDKEIDADIRRIVAELDLLAKDKTITRYKNPTKTELEEIIDKTSTYTGTFFHSEVTLFCDENETDEELKQLMETVEKLSENKANGIYLFYQFPSFSKTQSLE